MQQTYFKIFSKTLKANYNVVSWIGSQNRERILEKLVACCLVAELCPTLLRPHGWEPARLLCPWDFPGKSTGVGCHFLLEGIFPTQGLNPRLLDWQVDSLPLSHQGNIRKASEILLKSEG